MGELLNKNRLKVRQKLGDAEWRKFFSAAAYNDYQVTAPDIHEFAYGKLIDIGCGNMPFKDIIPDKVTQYDTIDIEKRVPEVKFIGGIENMGIIKDSSYDSAICLEVLEHVQNPFKAIS